MDPSRYGEIGMFDAASRRATSMVVPPQGFTEYVTDFGCAIAGGFLSQFVIDAVRKIFDISAILGNIGEPLLILGAAYGLKRLSNEFGDGYRWADQAAAGMLGASAGKFGQALADLLAGRIKAPSNMIGMIDESHYNRLADLTLDALIQSGAMQPRSQEEIENTRGALRGALPVAARWATAPAA